MKSAYQELIEQIREKCRRDNWFGPNDFKRGRVAWAKNFTFQAGFVFPTATEEQLKETERALCLTLPPLLRALYKNIANGSFGPGAGIRGVVGGYGEGTFTSGNDETILKHHYDRERLVDVRNYAEQWRRSSTGEQVLNIPSDAWPRQLVPICDLGCQQEVCVDQAGQTYLWYPSEEDDSLFTLSKETTFDQWIRTWIEGR